MPAHLVVGHLDGQPRFPTDPDGFVHRAQDTGPLVSHVGDVDPSAPARDAGEGDDFLGPGESSGDVCQAGGEAERTLVHAAGDHRLHLRELGGCRRPVRVPHDFLTDRPVPDEHREVGCGPVAGEGVEPGAERPG